MRESAVLTCILSRHSDGKIRQRAIAVLFDDPNVTWVTTYLLAPVGEYVIEILNDIEKCVDRLDPGAYGLVLRDNIDYLATLELRGV